MIRPCIKSQLEKGGPDLKILKTVCPIFDIAGVYVLIQFFFVL